MFLVFILLLSLICGGYFYINLIFLPKKIIPQITEQLKLQLKKDVAVKNVYLTPSAHLVVEKIVVFNQQEKNDILGQAQGIHVKTSYRAIFNSWRKEKDKLEVPLFIDIKKVKINLPPLSISGQAQARLNIHLDLENPTSTNYLATLQLEKFSVSQIPFWGQIEDINGLIKILPDEISSSNLQGTVNHAQAKLDFKLTDFKNPKLDLKAELSPLLISAQLFLSENSLNIENINAQYNQIKLTLDGKISGLNTNPNFDLESKLNLALEDLVQLPLEIKAILLAFKPSGLVEAQAQIQGPFNDLSKLSGNFSVSSPKFLINNFEFTKFSATAGFNQGKLNIDNLSASVFDSICQATAKLDLTSPAIPYNLNLKISDFSLANLKNVFNLTQNLSGRLSPEISLSGEIKDLNKLNLNLAAQIENFNFENFNFASPLKLSGEIIIDNLKNIAIQKLICSDDVFSLALDGKISNIYTPEAKLAGFLNFKLEGLKTSFLKSFQFLQNLPMQGALQAKFELNGPLLKFGQLEIPFTLTGDEIKLYQFSGQELKINGKFKPIRIAFNSVSGKLYGGQFFADGFLNLIPGQNADFSLKTQLENLNIEKFVRETKLLAEDFKGFLSAKVDLNGKGLNLETLDAQAMVFADLDQASVKSVPLGKANLTLDATFQNQDLDLRKLSLIYKTIEVTGKGKIGPLLKNPGIDLKLQTHLNLEDLNKLPFNFKSINLEQLNPQGTVAAQINTQGPLTDWTMLKINTQIISERIGIKNVFFENLNVAGTLNNKLLNLKTNAHAYEGNISLNINADLLTKDFAYTGKTQIDKVNIGKLIKESKIISQPHEGIFSLEGNFEGKGLRPETIIANAKVQLTQAKLSGFEMLRAIGGLLRIAFLSNFNVSEGKGTFTIKDSSLSTQDTQLIGPDASINAKGKIGFDQSLDFIVRLILSQAAAQKTDINILNNFFTYENEQYLTELDIKGTLSSPKPDLSKFIQEKLKQQVQKVIKKEMIKTLENIFFKK